MDDKALVYFSSINPLARKIVKDEEVLRKAIGKQWNSLDWKQQEELIDDFMVDRTAREKFADVEKLHSYPESFPKLKVETGEKIVVDFENDFWTWQDEHSSPFNWRSKSQQDLTLDDLEPEVLCKPPAKAKTQESETKIEVATEAPRQFSLQTAGSIWESPFLQGMKKPDFINRSRSSSPAKSATSKESLASRSKTPEEINYAFKGSMDDISSMGTHSIYENDRSPSVSSGEILSTSPSKDNDKKAPKRQRSFSKSPIKSVLSSSKKSDTGSQSLVTTQDEHEQAFDNPALKHEWSNFVNDNKVDDDEEISSATPSPYKTLLKAPEPVTIDRGDHSDGLISNEYQSGVLTGSKDDFEDEILVIESTNIGTQSDGELEDPNASTASMSGFAFLDNW